MDPARLVQFSSAFLKQPEELLVDAIENGDVLRVQDILKSDVRLNMRDSRMRSPLHIAAELGHADIAAALLDHGAAIEAADSNWKTPLHSTVIRDKHEVAALLMERGARKEALDDKKRTPLHLAALFGSTEVAKELIRREANVEALDDENRTPLHVASAFGRKEILEALLEAGASLEARDEYKETPLHCAASQGCLATMEALISRGSDVDAQRADGSTPLHMALKWMEQDAAIKLLESGANVQKVDAQSRRALHLAAGLGFHDAVVALVEKDANLEFGDEDMWTALHHAVDKNRVEMVRFLLERGANVEAQTELGERSLHLAAKRGAEETILILLEAGASLETKDKEKARPLDYIADKELKERVAESYKSLRPTTFEVSKLATNVSGLCLDDTLTSSTDDIGQETLEQLAEEGHGSSDRSEWSGTDDDSSQSEADGWLPDVLFGSRLRMLRGLELLKPGDSFSKKYTVLGHSVPGKPHIKFVSLRYGQIESAVLKFYHSEEIFRRTSEHHADLRHCRHICSMIEPLEEGTGFPPCLVFERGLFNASEWIQLSERTAMDKRWCLQQVLAGIQELHQQEKVHCDIKPSNVMLSGGDARWKLMDLDATQTAGTDAVAAFTWAYAAPEVIQAVKLQQNVVARKTMDVWSFGVLAYEIITGERFYGTEATEEDIYEFMLDSGKVQGRLQNVREESIRTVLQNTLKLSPEDRWTVAEAMHSDAFRACDTTTLEAAAD